jgi:hypothetical protein
MQTTDGAMGGNEMPAFFGENFIQKQCPQELARGVLGSVHLYVDGCAGALICLRSGWVRLPSEKVL